MALLLLYNEHAVWHESGSSGADGGSVACSLAFAATCLPSAHLEHISQMWRKIGCHWELSGKTNPLS